MTLTETMGSPLVVIVRYVLLACGFLFLYFDSCRQSAVKGTHIRYVYSSLCRVLQFPAVLWPLTGVVNNAVHGLALWAFIDFCLFLMMLALVRMFHKSKDDDFWTSFKTKSKAKLKSIVSKLKSSVSQGKVPAPSPA